MIVRDEETRLPACLASTTGLFDEIVAVDTGSVDRTREVARSFGATVIDFPWRDDFSAARNAALSECSRDYLFWIDADEVLPQRARYRIRRLLHEIADDNTIYIMNEVSNRADGRAQAGYDVTLSPRLFPNHRGARWERRVYEHVFPSLVACGLRPVATNVDIAHRVSYRPTHVIQRFQRNQRLVEIELAEDPKDPVALYNFGLSQHMAGLYSGNRKQSALAQQCLERLVERFAPDGKDPERSELKASAYLLLACVYRTQLRFSESLRTCACGRARYPRHIGLLGFEADLLHDLGLWQEAQERWRIIPEVRQYRHDVATWYREFGAVVSARVNYAYSLEQTNQCYEASAVWADLARNHAGMFDAIPGLRRTLRRILLDAMCHPRLFLEGLNEAFGSRKRNALVKLAAVIPSKTSEPVSSRKTEPLELGKRGTES